MGSLGRSMGAAIEVHRQLGPGMLESAHEACLDEASLRNWQTPPASRRRGHAIRRWVAREPALRHPRWRLLHLPRAASRPRRFRDGTRMPRWEANRRLGRPTRAGKRRCPRLPDRPGSRPPQAPSAKVEPAPSVKGTGCQRRGSARARWSSSAQMRASSCLEGWPPHLLSRLPRRGPAWRQARG